MYVCVEYTRALRFIHRETVAHVGPSGGGRFETIPIHLKSWNSFLKYKVSILFNLSEGNEDDVSLGQESFWIELSFLDQGMGTDIVMLWLCVWLLCTGKSTAISLVRHLPSSRWS
jgi:hypothetical protein